MDFYIVFEKLPICYQTFFVITNIFYLKSIEFIIDFPCDENVYLISVPIVFIIVLLFMEDQMIYNDYYRFISLIYLDAMGWVRRLFDQGIFIYVFWLDYFPLDVINEYYN
jgi:hypothetical protein